MKPVSRLTVDAEHIPGDMRLQDVRLVGVWNVHLGMAGEAAANGPEIEGATIRCKHCKRALYEGEFEPIDSRVPQGPTCIEHECEECEGVGAIFIEDGKGLSAETDCPAGCEQGHGKHEPEPIPLSWCNSAGIGVDEEEDSVTVRISVGDPRGWFAFTVRRARYTDSDGKEVDELRLSLPHESDGAPHMTLVPINDHGYYRLGN